MTILQQTAASDSTFALMRDAATASTVLSAVAAIASVVVAAAALWMTWRTNKGLARQAQISNIPRLYLDEYSYAKSSRAIELRDGPDTTLTTLKELREYVRGRYGDPAARERFLARSCDRENLAKRENRIAYELSRALQQVGASVFVGAIPLDYVLADNTIQIVEDWAHSHRLVQAIRRGFAAPPAPGVRAPWIAGYHRRHAEWLAYVAALWLHAQKWYDGMLHVFLDEVAPTPPGPRQREEQVEEIRRRVRLLQRAEREIVSPATVAHVKRVLSHRRR